IQSALSRQKRVMEANRRTQEYLGNLITSNAATIKQHTTEIGDVYNQPVVAMEKITQAHNDLMEAMDTADRIKQEGIQTARQNISKLSELSEELSNRSASLRERAERGNTPSVEA
ncbi:MAG: toxic anion resistance protein, partial [Chloroflexota bacterium]